MKTFAIPLANTRSFARFAAMLVLLSSIGCVGTSQRLTSREFTVPEMTAPTEAAEYPETILEPTLPEHEPSSLETALGTNVELADTRRH